MAHAALDGGLAVVAVSSNDAKAFPEEAGQRPSLLRLRGGPSWASRSLGRSVAARPPFAVGVW